MAWWVYKCNSRNREYQNAYGDWDEFFDDPEEHWGKSEWVPELARLKMIFDSIQSQPTVF